MNRKYTNEFKLEVIGDYYTNDLGVRQTAAKWGLPSKNYIESWELYLKRKNLIPKDWIKKPPLKAPKHLNVYSANESPELKSLRDENEFLRCSLDYYKQLEKFTTVKKKKNTGQ